MDLRKRHEERIKKMKEEKKENKEILLSTLLAVFFMITLMYAGATIAFLH